MSLHSRDGAINRNTLIEAALFLADEWPVFACDASKRPITSRGLHDATRDPAIIREQFSRPGAALIGVPMGAVSGVFAVDIDVRDGARGGEWLAANEHRIPETRRHRTMSGGSHLLFQMPAHDIRNSASKIAPNVDVRGTGGYIIFPPSPGYAIATDAMPAQAPRWLLDILAPPAQPSTPAPRITRDDTAGSPYGMRALSDECDAVMNAAPGVQESTLNAAALKIGALVAGGELAQGYAREALISAGLGMRSQPGREPWTDRDIRAKVERGMTDGGMRPRQAAPREIRHTIRVEIVPPEPPPYDEAPDWALAEPIIEPEPEAKAERKPGKAPLWVDREAWDETAIPRRPWVVPGYFMRGSVSVLSGQGAGGKSSLVVAWSIAAALGQPIGEFRPAGPLMVINYNVEDDQQEQQRRYSAGLHAAQKRPADIAEKVIRCGPSTIGTLFERNHDTGRIIATEAMQALEDLCMETGADVLICDPLAELHNAEENDNTAMRAVIAAFRGLAARLGIAVMILHHDRKGSNAPGDMDRMRGASAITGAVRVMLTLTPMSSEEADKFGVEDQDRRRHFRIDGAKSNYAIAQDAEWWKLRGYDLLNGEEVAAARPWTPPSTFDGVSMDDCIAVLNQMAAGTPTGFAWGAHHRAGDEWAGRLIMALGKTEGQARAMLAGWVTAGTISIVSKPGPRRGHPRSAYEVNQAAVAEMRQA